MRKKSPKKSKNLNSFDLARRRLLGLALAVCSGALRWVQAAPQTEVETTSADSVIATIIADNPEEYTDRIRIEMADLAEDGAVVPIKLYTDLPRIEQVALVSEKNPIPLIAVFDLGPSVLPGYLSTRIKLAESTVVHALVKAGGKVYRGKTFVAVTAGGCS